MDWRRQACRPKISQDVVWVICGARLQGNGEKQAGQLLVEYLLTKLNWHILNTIFVRTFG